VRRRAPDEVDLDALNQRVADLETLLTSPGWAVVCAEANKLFGVRTFTDQIEHLARTEPVGEVGPKTIALVAARVAAGRLINLPSELREEVKRKILQATPSEPRGHAANVEMSDGRTQ
jgi:hypothetical protein